MILSTTVSWVVAFFALFLTDLFWTFYIQSVQQKRAIQGSLWAVLLFVFGAVAVSGYVHDPWLIIPSALGAFAGTYVAILKGK